MATGEVRILIVEGRGANEESFVPALAKKWEHISVAQTGKEALSACDIQPPSIIVYDASSLRSSGVRTCRRLKKQFPDIPLIQIRPAGQPKDEDALADIYLQRPFTARKLANRIKALLPATDNEDQILRAGNVVLYLGKRSVDVEGKGEQQLTPKLSRLLEEFMRNPDTVLSRKHLMEQVWQTSYVGDTRTLDVHMRWTRELIEANPKKPEILTTVRGIGYVLNSAALKPSQNGKHPN